MMLLPSLNRPTLLQKCLQTAINAKMTVPGIVLVDETDPSLKEYVKITLPEGWLLQITRGVTMAEKVAEIFDPSWDWIGIINDDFEFVTHEWDKKLLKYLDGKTFVSSNDRKLRSFVKPSGVTVWSMALLKTLGWRSFFPQGMQHLYIDDVWLNLGSATGSWRLAPEVVVLHKHALDGEMEQDATFHKTYDPFFAGTSPDKEAYERFMMYGFQGCVKAIQDLQDYLPGEQQNPKVFS